MKPFIELFLLGVTTPIRLACDIASGIAEGISWHRAILVANIRHCEFEDDFIPTISCAYKINHPVRVIAESVMGPVHLVIRPHDWTDTVFLRFEQKVSLRAATWRDILLGKDTPIENNLICVDADFL